MKPRPSSFSSRPLATLALLAALLALPAPALAGTPDDPEIVDDALDAGAGNAHADIDTAWVEQPAPDFVRLTLRLTMLPEATVGTAYGIVFDANGRTFVAGLAAIPEPKFVIANYDRGTKGASGLEIISGSYTTGAGATIMTDVPLEILPENTTALTGLAAITLDIKSDFAGLGVILELDAAEGSRDFALATATPTEEADQEPVAPASAAPEPEGASPAADPAAAPDAPRDVPAPGIVVLLVALGAGALGRPRR